MPQGVKEIMTHYHIVPRFRDGVSPFQTLTLDKERAEEYQKNWMALGVYRSIEIVPCDLPLEFMSCPRKFPPPVTDGVVKRVARKKEVGND